MLQPSTPPVLAIYKLKDDGIETWIWLLGSTAWPQTYLGTGYANVTFEAYDFAIELIYLHVS